MDCKYTWKSLPNEVRISKTFNSYTELFNTVLSLPGDFTDFSDVTDILYSPANQQDAADLVALIDNLGKKGITYPVGPYHPDDPMSIIANEPQCDSSNISTVEFPLSDAMTDNGNPVVGNINERNFMAQHRKTYVDAYSEHPRNGMTVESAKDEAERIYGLMIANNKKIQDDKVLLHKLYTHDTIQGGDKGSEKFTKEIPAGSRIANVDVSLFNQLNTFLSDECGKMDGCTIRRNINLTSNIIGTDQSMSGHIDYLIIGSDGTLNAYIFKTTVLDPLYWNLSIETPLYQQLLALLKMMLANQGLNVKNMRLNVVPVKLEYDINYDKIVNIMVYRGRGIRQYSNDKDNNYLLRAQEQIARKFILDNSIAPRATDGNLNRANQIINALFPECNIVDYGLEKSAKMWITDAPSIPNPGDALVIRKIGDKGHAYDVIINGLTYHVANNAPKERNEEILALVNEHLSELPLHQDLSLLPIRAMLHNILAKGYEGFGTGRHGGRTSSNLYSVFAKYIPRQGLTENSLEVEWEPLDYLESKNILLLKNQQGVIDVIALCPFNLNASTNFKRGNNLLGSYLPTLQYNSLDGNYGNVYAVRTMALLNEIIPKLEGCKLGTMKIMSSLGALNYFMYDIGYFNRRFYTEIILHLNRLLPSVKTVNNFLYALFVDPCEAIWNEYIRLIAPNELPYGIYHELGIELLDPEQLKGFLYQKIDALLNIQNNILRVQRDFNNPTEVERALSGKRGSRDKELATLYDMASRAYLNLTGDSPMRETDWDDMRSLLLNSFSHPDENVRRVVDNFLTTEDAILEELLTMFDKNMRGWFMRFYEKGGYTLLENMIIGSLNRMFTNLLDPDYLDILQFKNPYDMSNNLNDNERTLLKHILYLIHYINTGGRPFFDESDEKAIKQYINDGNTLYLWMPLERASRATKRSSADAWIAGTRNAFKRMRNAIDRFQENMLGVTSEEMALIGNSDDFYSLRLRNLFDLSMPNSYDDIGKVERSRRAMIEKYGVAFFETNLEKVAFDYLKRNIMTELLSKFLIGTKAMLLQLHLTGDHGGNEDVINNEIKYILKYLKVNVFHTSVMTKRGQAVTGLLQPLRRLATTLLIGGNLVGMARDTIIGAEQSFLRVVTKLDSNLDIKAVSAAYKYVTQHATSNAMASNLISKLAIAYRLAGSDIETVSQRMLTGRNGILNFENYLYGTMRTPDFMNRMVLFIARCMQDGVMDYNGNGAFSINDENMLVYDWKKDKRFEAYAAGRENDPDYLKQKSLYYSMIRDYNETHRYLSTDQRLNVGDPLIRAYTSAEVRNILGLADNIYGAYDRSKKAMVEYQAYGWAFALFFSWMGGIANNYFATPQRSVLGKISKVQDVDEHGNKLYFTEDGIPTTKDTGLIVLRDVPAIVLGVMPMFKEVAKVTNLDGYLAFKEFFTSSQLARALGYKVIADGLAIILLYFIFGQGIPWLTTGVTKKSYDEYKKTMIDNPFILNALVEIAYRGFTRANDQFFGPIVLYDFFLHGGQLPFISVPSRLFRNAFGFAIGNKNWTDVWTNMGGLTSSFRDSYKAEIRKEKLGLK